MSKSDNGTFILAAGVSLAVIALASSKQNAGTQTPAPYKPPIIKGGPVEFIKTYYPVALAAQKLYPQVPWQLFLAFSGLESAWGKAAPRYNFYGMKPGKAWKGEKQLITTHEILPRKTGYNFPEVISVIDSTKYPGKYDWKVKDYFRAFNTPLEAFKSFGDFITHNCYGKAITAATIHDKVQKIKDCGYATDPGYVKKIDNLVVLVEQAVKQFVK